MLVYRMLLYYKGWCVRYGVLVYGMGCYYTVCGVRTRDGVLVYGMGC